LLAAGRGTLSRSLRHRADAWEIEKRAEDRLGALSAALDKSAGGSNLQAKPLHALAKAAPADVWLRKQYPEAL